MRLDLTLQCGECKEQNYRSSRKRESSGKLQLNKYCPSCRTHTVHKEKKK